VTDIFEFIIQGYRNGYYQKLLLNTHGGDFYSKATEYLFTVIIAQELLKWRKAQTQNYSFSIHFEHSAVEFKKSCFEAVRLVKPGEIWDGRIIRRDTHTSIRNESGRIDIAVLYHPRQGLLREARAFAGIEVKGINPRNTKVKQDILRLIDCLCAEDSIGDNSLKSCYVVYGVRLDCSVKIFENEDFLKGKLRMENDVENLLTSIPEVRKVNYSNRFFEISKTTAEEFRKYNIDEDGLTDYQEVVAGSGAILGVLIHFTVKAKGE